VGRLIDTNAVAEKNPSPVVLTFIMGETPSSLISRIVQDGFFLKARAGCSLREFLCEECGIPPEYVEGRISTIFLDYNPVDDMDAARIRDGLTIALSAAMPGVVGAAMRRGGAYAALRDSITYVAKEGHDRSGPALVRLKLFNMVMDELGPGFLRKGVYVKCHDLALLLATQADEFWETCRELVVNGKPIECSKLRGGQYQFDSDMALLRISTTDPSVR